LTTIGFGAWAVGGGNWDWGWGVQDDAESIDAIHKAIDLGINWIDTAPAYGLGHSEEMVRKALQGKRQNVCIATKCGLVWTADSGGKVDNNLKAASIRNELEASLTRLGVNEIDLYQIHWPFPDEDIEEAWTEIAKFVKEGKIRYAGVSNCDLGQLKRLQAIHPIASLQPEYNMLERSVENDILAYCVKNQIGVVAYSPMASGLLTGKYTKETVKTLHPEDWRLKYSEHFGTDHFDSNLAKIEKLAAIAAAVGKSLGELAVAWVLRRPEITSAIVGSRRSSQIAQIVPSGDWVLDPRIVAEIEAIL
jgi:aryl-alcohol dehydrogenase-like predicted oxidoreductase